MIRPAPSPPPVHFPARGKGRLGAARQAAYDDEVRAFVARLHEIRSRLDFSPGARGWGYLLEGDGLITKGQFDRMETLLGDWRKDGTIPLSMVGEDDRRLADNLEALDTDNPEDYAESFAQVAAECWESYVPVSFWEFQPCYLEQAAEKVDLKALFGPVCAEYHIPIVNFAGWTDINSRVAMMQRFRKHQEAGRKCVLLYCGDHDPAGLLISGKIRENLMALEKAAGWSPTEDNLTIDRFGLNYDFVVANNLTWIDNLETGSGKDLADPKHPDYFKPYVQYYIKMYWNRKVEANALVARHEQGRELCRRTILKYIAPDGIAAYEKRLAEERERVKEVLPAVLRKLLRRRIDSLIPFQRREDTHEHPRRVERYRHRTPRAIRRLRHASRGERLAPRATRPALYLLGLRQQRLLPGCLRQAAHPARQAQDTAGTRRPCQRQRVG
jgi:hypothetical protein